MKEYVYDKTAQFSYNKFPVCMEDMERNPITGMVIEYVNKKHIIITFWKDGMRHNPNGPAIIDYNGELSYYFNDINLGTNLSKKEFEKKLKELVFK